MKITDLNAEGGIGSNCLLLETDDGTRIVVDCGLHPKKAGKESLPRLDFLGDEPLDLVILTHCHLDHLAALPVLMRYQARARIAMSRPTAMLFTRMLHNSANVMKRQRDELGLPELPLYTHTEVDRLEHLSVALPYGHRRAFEGESGGRVALTLHPAGHVPGAAGFTLEAEGRRFFFTGDVLFDRLRTLPPARFPQEPVDVLVTETTRGGTRRIKDRSRELEIESLFESVSATVERGGSVLIPAFALGRMQELIAIMHEMRLLGKLPEAPIFCSGLGMDLANYLDEITRKTELTSFRTRMIKDLGIRSIPRELRPGRPPKRPAIFILSSGMMVARTPSYNVAASLMADSRSALFFVGYCDPDTPGGALLQASRGESFSFDTLEYQCTIECELKRFDLSGHADREELLDFAQSVRPETVMLTHGDPEARSWFAQHIPGVLPAARILDPAPLQAVEV